MKKNSQQPNQNRDGFSLIITITMVVLLSLVAVGLLSLSSTVLRSSNSEKNLAEARANARLALNIAIGELQKNAGLDTRVTARADILGEVSHPRLTGVWESWAIEPNQVSASDYSESSKESRLLTWLASGAPPSDQSTNDFVRSTFDDPITLWGSGSLGSLASNDDQVRASRIEIRDNTSGGTNNTTGAYAWAALDEGVKARVNTLIPENREGLTQLGSGIRAGVEMIDGLSNINADAFVENSTGSEAIEKAVTFKTFGLAADQLAGVSSDTTASLLHDISPYSAGLLTDTARGGLRTDFNLMSSQEELPELYSHVDEEFISIEGEGLYESLLDLNTGQQSSDPSWNSLFQFARLHEDEVQDDSGTPIIQAQIPENWEAAQGDLINTTSPDELVLMPTIAKVQMIFSLAGRDLYSVPRYRSTRIPSATQARRSDDMHTPQAQDFRAANTRFAYDLHLIYSPVVVLHNPYNTALEFNNLRVEFHHIPFAMRLFRNGQPLSTDLVPFETMFQGNQDGILFSPFIDPNSTYQDNFNGDEPITWDFNFGSSLTSNIMGMPGWRGDGVGYSCDWLAGNLTTGGSLEDGFWRGSLALAPDDEISGELAPSTTANNSSFLVTLRAQSGSTQTVANAIEINYGDAENLRETILGSPDSVLSFPSGDQPPILGRDIIEWGGTPLSDLENVMPIATVSLQAKTTFGGLENGEQNFSGRIASKPFSFAHGSIGASIADLTSEHPSAHSHEIDIQTLPNGTQDLIEGGDDDNNGRSFFLTGHGSGRGTQFGVNYEVPLTPLQSLSTLNGANPGGSSSILPRFAAPISNSLAHPLLSRDSIQQTGSNGERMYDHSFLMNLALQDRFYFSGLGSQTGSYGSGLTTESSLQQFLQDGFLNDPRLSLYQSKDNDESLLTGLDSDPLAHEKIAAWQIMNGAFNINSTSVNAWKSMLSSAFDSEAQINELQIAGSEVSSGLSDLSAAPNGSTRISRFRVPLSPSLNDGGNPNFAYFTGPREYSETEINELAEEIVEQIKERGPFLSLAEFVNRQVGTSSLALSGALQAAIDATNLNEELAADAEAGSQIEENIVSDYQYEDPEAATGSSYQGAAGDLTQADLMGVLGNAATARSDTFTIRGYGESRNQAGQVQATAMCEAVVQRYPEWVDPQDTIEAKPGELQSEVNQQFGRRFRVVTFRWLAPEEV